MRESHYKLDSRKYQNISLMQLVMGTTPEFLLYVRYNPGRRRARESTTGHPLRVARAGALG